MMTDQPAGAEAPQNPRDLLRPWRATAYQGQRYPIIEVTGGTGFYLDSDPGGFQVTGNAPAYIGDMIAALPDLVDALEDLLAEYVAVLACGPYDAEDQAEHRMEVMAARAALAKVRGEG